MRLNLGSGPRAVAGWENVDRSPNVLLDRFAFTKRLLRRLGVLTPAHMQPWDRGIRRLDMRRLPYADNSATAIYSSHALEHLYLKDAVAVIEECARVLRPGGIVRLALPDSVQLARDLVAGESAADPEAGWVFNRGLLAHTEERPRRLRLLSALAAGHVHRWQPTETMVRAMLKQAGFVNVRRCEFRQGELPDLELIETRPESFFLEAEAS